MKLRSDFVTYKTESEHLLVPTGESSVAALVKGNKTLGAILELLKEDTTEEGIVEAMKARFDAPEEVIARDVKKALSELRKVGAIEE